MAVGSLVFVLACIAAAGLKLAVRSSESLLHDTVATHQNRDKSIPRLWGWREEGGFHQQIMASQDNEHRATDVSC